MCLRTVERFVDGRIECQIPLLNFLVDDRPDFPRPGILRNVRPLPADFVGDADAHRPLPTLRSGEPRPDMRAHVDPTAVGLQAIEDVKTRLATRAPTGR